MAKKGKYTSWIAFIAALAGGGVFGYTIASFLGKEDQVAQAAGDKPSLFIIIPMLFLAFFIVILIHEFGHVLGGLLMGNEFSLMIVGPLKLQKDDGKFSLTFNKSIAMAGGLALTLPTKVEGFKKRRAIVIGSGPLASLVLAIGGYLLAQYLGDSISRTTNTLILSTYLMSAAIFVATIIPSKVGGFMSDGMQLLMTLRNDKMAKKYANFMHLFALNNKGTEPKDFPVELFGELTDQPIKDIYDYAFQQYLYYKDINENNLESAQNRIQVLEEKLDLYPSNFQPEVQAEWVIFYGLIQPNAAEVERLLELMDGKKPSMSKVSLNVFEAAVAMSKGDLASTKVFGEQVLATKKLEGTTKMYQELIRERVMD